MADNCWEEQPVETLGLCPQDEVDAGVAEEIFYSIVENVKTIPKPAEGATTLEGVVTITEAIEMEAGKGFGRMKLQADLNGLTAALTGNVGNKKVQTTIAAFIAGAKAQLYGFQERYRNAKMIFIIPDLNGSNWLVGDKLKPARFDNFDIVTGQTAEDNNGGTMNIIARKGPRLYTGVIPLSDAPVVVPGE